MSLDLYIGVDYLFERPVISCILCALGCSKHLRRSSWLHSCNTSLGFKKGTSTPVLLSFVHCALLPRCFERSAVLSDSSRSIKFTR